MNRLPCLVAALLSIATAASAEEQFPIFRHAISCSALGKEGICAFGKIPQGKAVSVITKDWKSSATPQEEFPNTDFDNGIDTITRLRAARPMPPGTGMIVVAAPAESVQIVGQMELHDEKITQRVRKYVQQTKGTDQEPERKYRINTRLIKLSPTVLIAEATVTSQIEYIHPETGEKLILCAHCDDDTMLILVRKDLIDLFADVRASGGELFCGGVVSAFALFGRMHILSTASSCEGDAFSYDVIHDLSGPTPKLVFH